ncbi:hypothetical protein X777_04754 [Ooceraea biroi]|uniref:DUF8207 domain-containing protein n=1 Tax=Ooceraea biroi TaxID=2015173 RepID=A0A026WHF1_OOCBI|nr:hypothetical protein X777_04754 [Ooceraea biroi]
MENECALESHFKPIVEPLKRLVEYSVDEPEAVDASRVKRKFEHEDADASSSAIVTPQKLKIGWRYVGVGALFTDSGSGPTSKTSAIDNVYGVYISETGTMLGNKRFDVGADDSMFVGGTRYEGTPGLYELIFMRTPDESVYNVHDTTLYCRILLAKNAHKQRHQEQGQIKVNKGHKYRTIIAPLMGVRPTADRGGAGMERPPPPTMRVTDNKIDYVHWNDPNELVDRLRLIEASRGAGNDSHDAEFLSIIEELREAGVIAP